MSDYRQLCLLLFPSSPHRGWLGSTSGLNNVLINQAAVLREGSQHHAVHTHPADKRRSSTFVEAIDAFFPDGLEEAIERALELRVCLEADLNRVERVAIAEVSQIFGIECNSSSVKTLTQHLVLLRLRTRQQRSPCTGRRERGLWLLFRHSC